MLDFDEGTRFCFCRAWTHDACASWALFACDPVRVRQGVCADVGLWWALLSFPSRPQTRPFTWEPSRDPVRAPPRQEQRSRNICNFAIHKSCLFAILPFESMIYGFTMSIFYGHDNILAMPTAGDSEIANPSNIPSSGPTSSNRCANHQRTYTTWFAESVLYVKIQLKTI